MTDTLTTEMQSTDTSRLRDKAGAVKDAVSDLASEAGSYASDRMAVAKDSAATMIKQAKETAAEYTESLMKTIQRNPYKAVAIAVGVGLIAGLLLKRSK